MNQYSYCDKGHLMIFGYDMQCGACEEATGINLDALADFLFELSDFETWLGLRGEEPRNQDVGDFLEHALGDAYDDIRDPYETIRHWRAYQESASKRPDQFDMEHALHTGGLLWVR
jgi:hypothetical protein